MILFGIIDIHGAESVIEFDSTNEIMEAFETGKLPGRTSEILKMLELRRRFNGHRHPIVYACKISEEDGQAAQEICEMDPILAAKLLMRNSDKFGIVGKGDWELLQRLQPEFMGELSGERFSLMGLSQE